MARTDTDQSPLRISEKADAERKFLIHPESNDKYVRTGQQVVTACNLTISYEVWVKEVDSMLIHVKEWCGEHLGVEMCFVRRDSKTTLFFVPKSEQFDFKLADELVALNTKLVKDFNVGMVEVQQIPMQELDRFVNPATAVRVYGRPTDAHTAVEA